MTRRTTTALAVVALLALGASACADDDADDVVDVGDEATTTTVDGPTGDDPSDPSGDGDAPQAGDEWEVTVAVGEDCYEIWYRQGEAEFRSRSFPSSWEPGSTHDGTMVAESESELRFETDDGEVAQFQGGVEAAFTMDCPVYDGIDPVTNGLGPEPAG